MDRFLPVANDCHVLYHPHMARVQHCDDFDQVAQVQGAATGQLLHAIAHTRDLEDRPFVLLLPDTDEMLDYFTADATGHQVFAWSRANLDQCGAHNYAPLQSINHPRRHCSLSNKIPAQWSHRDSHFDHGAICGLFDCLHYFHENLALA